MTLHQVPAPFILVLDDYHAIEARGVEDVTLDFVLEHLPPDAPGHRHP